MYDHPLLKPLFASNKHTLPRHLLESLVEAGGEVREPLRALVGDIPLLHMDSPGGGFAPAHALAVLVELQDEAAVRPALELFLDLDAWDLVRERYMELLPRFGELLVEPALALVAHAMPDARRGLGAGSRTAAILTGDARRAQGARERVGEVRRAR